MFQGNGEEVAGLIILEKKVAGLSAKSLERFTLRARRAVGLSGRVNILLTSSEAMRALNFRFREKNKTTDVLSFPADFNGEDKRAFAGEIAISADIWRAWTTSAIMERWRARKQAYAGNSVFPHR